MFLAGKMYTFTRKLDPEGWRKKISSLGNQVKMVDRQENREESCDTVSTAGPEFIWTFS